MIVEMSSLSTVTPTGWPPTGRVTGALQVWSFVVEWLTLTRFCWTQVAQSIPVESLAIVRVSVFQPLRMIAGNPLSRV